MGVNVNAYMFDETGITDIENMDPRTTKIIMTSMAASIIETLVIIPDDAAEDNIILYNIKEKLPYKYSTLRMFLHTQEHPDESDILAAVFNEMLKYANVLYEFMDAMITANNYGNTKEFLKIYDDGQFPKIIIVAIEAYNKFLDTRKKLTSERGPEKDYTDILDDFRQIFESKKGVVQ